MVIFSHGLEGSPQGSKIVAMQQVAERHGHATASLDYQGQPPLERVNTLLSFAQHRHAAPILVGSSLGGHVSAAASIPLAASGLFLLAPAFYMPGFEQYTPPPARCPISIVHGWRDEVVPVDNSIRYAREHGAQLQLIDADHRMLDCIALICDYFDLFLRRLSGDYQVGDHQSGNHRSGDYQSGDH